MGGRGGNARRFAHRANGIPRDHAGTGRGRHQHHAGRAEPAFETIVNTPPFPEYTSGHSVQSGSAAQVLTDLFGDLAFTDRTHQARGLPVRSFNSFFDAAEEAAISRLYGGIHFRSAIERGLDQGRCVGRAVSALHFKRTPRLR